MEFSSPSKLIQCALDDAMILAEILEGVALEMVPIENLFMMSPEILLSIPVFFKGFPQEFVRSQRILPEIFPKKSTGSLPMISQEFYRYSSKESYKSSFSNSCKDSSRNSCKYWSLQRLPKNPRIFFSQAFFRQGWKGLP